MLQALCCAEEVGARNLVFFRVKWLQPAMKGTSYARWLWLRLFHPRIGFSSVFCKKCLFPCAGFGFLVVDRIGINGCMIVGMLCCHVVVQIAPLAA